MDFYIRAAQEHSLGAIFHPTLDSLKEMPWHKEEHILHGHLFQFFKILENGLWAGGLSLRTTRQACFLSP